MPRGDIQTIEQGVGKTKRDRKRNRDLFAIKRERKTGKE